MNVNVNKNAQQTHKYWRHIVSEIIKQAPIQVGDFVRFEVKEDSQYFPIFSERPVIMRRFRMVKHKTEPNDAHYDAVIETPLRQEVDQTWDEKNIRDGKEGAVIFFTQRKLDDMCVMRGAKATEDGPIVINFVFKVIDPIKIYDEAKKLEIKVLRGKNLSKFYVAYPTDFLESPSRIKWGPTEIDISAAPLAVRICRLVYKRPAGEWISCDDVAAVLDIAGTENEKKMHDSIFSAIQRINKLVKNHTGKSLFRWTNNGFIRNA